MRNALRLACAFSAWGLMLGLGAVSAAEPPLEWKAGVARVDTTPTEPVWMSGYASRSSPSQGVAHPLAAKALALEDAGGNKVVLVACDIISFSRDFSNRVAERVKSQHGLPRQNLALFASHSHSGPTPVDDINRMKVNGVIREKAQNNVDYTRDLENKIVDVIGQAVGHARARRACRTASAALILGLIAASPRPAAPSSSARIRPDPPMKPCPSFAFRTLAASRSPS